MSPAYLLIAVLALMSTAIVLEFLSRRRTQCSLRRLAGENRMHYSPRDQLRLTPRVAENLPVAGAGYVRVSNLMYASGEGKYRYVFTAEYTTGAVRSKKRVRRAAMFSEPRERTAAPERCNIRLADVTLPLIEQYRELLT